MHKQKMYLSLLFLVLLVIIVPHMQYAAGNVSPLIFGTNLTLNDANDQFLTSATTRTALQAIHVQVIRMPIRSSAAQEPIAAEVSAMQDIKAMGAIPLIIIHFQDSTGSKNVIQQANSIFGSSVVYYEFGNERDGSWNGGFSAQAYTQAWNQAIAILKPLATNGKFGGPVNYHSDPAYISTFYHTANPKPDFVSWHEYTCSNSQSSATCISNIHTWATHIGAIKSAIQQAGDTVPPLWVTEWNYDPNNPAGDSRATPSFQSQFTQTALQELANDGITGATHYVATGHTEYNLVNTGGSLTAEGQMFGQMYTQLVGSGGGITPPPGTTNTPTPTSSPNTSPTPTTGSGGASVHVTLCPHGLGNCGDNANAQSTGNTAPLHTTRTASVSFLNNANQSVGTAQGTVSYTSASQNFQGSLSGTIPPGQYITQVTLAGYLIKQTPGFVTVTQGQPVTLPAVSLVTGDINNDKQLDILDYNLLIACFGSKQSTSSCTMPPSQTSSGADINDDSKVDGTDYNLFLRELSVQHGG